MRTYDALITGDMRPQIVSEIPERVKAFFEGKTEYPVLVPVMRECRLVGGVLNTFHGTTLAHVVYRHGDQTIYLAQACKETVMRGDQLRLSPEVREKLESTGWFRETTPSGASIVVWTRGGTVCAAIARLHCDHLMEHVADAEGIDAW
jgi:hypothetical protein